MDSFYNQLNLSAVYLFIFTDIVLIKSHAMKPKRTFYIAMSFVIILATSLGACKKDEAEGIDKELLDMAEKTSGFTWYKNSDALLDKSSGSGHNYPYLRTRFDEIASQMLDQDGKIMDSITFPEGSFVVKELYSDGSTLARYALLYKQSNHASADENGWIWGYVNSDGTVAVSAEDKGKQCISCHSQQGNIDYMLMNLYFP